MSTTFMNKDRFVRTAQPINSTRNALHNIKRWEWIGEAGAKGRTFAEINARNSTYRKCIKRKNYAGNTSSIKGDLKHDLHGKWTRKR